jgi:hypothetical protein
MTDKAFAFVDEWVSEHIHAERDDGSAGGELEPAALARQCIADAEAAGIPAAEINDAYEDLAAFMEGQIEEAKERESGESSDDDFPLLDEDDLPEQDK